MAVAAQETAEPAEKQCRAPSSVFLLPLLSPFSLLSLCIQDAQSSAQTTLQQPLVYRHVGAPDATAPRIPSTLTTTADVSHPHGPQLTTVDE
jgi:hypothetical protein